MSRLPVVAEDARARPVVREIRALSRLAAPVAAAQVGMMALGVTDTIMVGHLSKLALAAVGLGNLYAFALLTIGFGTMMALDPLVSQAHGAGDREAVSLSFQRGLVLALFLSIPFMVAFLAAAPVLRALHQPADVIPIAAAFARALAPSVPAFLLFVALRQSLQAMSIVRPVLLAVLVGNIANALLDYLFVFGHARPFPSGAVGSAVATTICRYLMLLVVWGSAAGVFKELWRPPTRALFALRPLVHLLRIGVPIGLQVGLESWAFSFVSVLMGTFGKVIFDGHQIAMNLVSLAFMVPIGIGAAAATRVGNAIGRRDAPAARRSALVALGLGASVMTLSALAFGFAPRLLARAFTTDRTVIAAAATFLPIGALFEIFDGTQAVGCGVLRGAADTRTAAAINFLGYWILGLPLGALLTYRLGVGPAGLWWGETIALAVVSLLLVGRIWRRIGVGPLRSVVGQGGAPSPGATEPTLGPLP